MQNVAIAKSPLEALRTVANDPTAHADAEVTYQVGLETWQGGRTTVRVRANGMVGVSNRTGERDQAYNMTLPPTELKALLMLLVEHKLTEQRSGRSEGSPDEARMVLQFSDPATGIKTQNELWDNERWQNPDLKAIVAAFQKLMKAASKGRIRF